MSKQAADGAARKMTQRDWGNLHAALFRYCLVVTGNKEDAEDLSQNAWIKAIPVLMDQGHANPEAFLLRIAKNSWIDECRRKAAFAERLAGMRSEGLAADEELFETEHILQTLRSGLSPLQRTVFLLREGLDYSIAETARLLDTTEGAVKAAHHRARQALKAVREELRREDGSLPPPDEEERLLLARLTEAYTGGDAAALVRLMYEEECVPTFAHAAGVVSSPIAGGASSGADTGYSAPRAGLGLYMVA